MRISLRAVSFVFASALAVQLSAKSADIPTGKLPADAIPQHYALHLTVDPRSDRFSGETRSG